MDSRIKVNIIWEADDGRASTDDTFAVVVARILRPEIFEASDRAAELLDVLFLSRGIRNIACAVDVELENAIAAGNIYIIRTDAIKLLPAYLAWYINQPKVQVRLKEMSSGITIQTIPISVFLTLEIAVPPLDVQQSIARLAALQQREQVLTRKLMEKREQLVQAICHKAISRELVKEEVADEFPR